jgi:CHAT domain-containing protein
MPSAVGREFMVLEHPVARTIIGNDILPPKRSGLSRAFFNQLFRRKESLEILLVASNTPPDIPRVDYEVEALFKALPALFKNKIKVAVKTLYSIDATFDAVHSELEGGKYDIVHYAGHGVYDERTPEESGLPFRETRAPKSPIKRLKVPALKWALKESKVKFVYLSCCVGAAQAEPTKLQDNDFLGITDGLLQAGVPSILGYRWPIIDAGGERLAVAFYEHLAEEGEVDSALMLARREVANDRDDRSWLLPILIAQA